MLRIGVPESNVAGPDVGIRQSAQILTTEGLILNGEDGRPSGRLAESWNVSPDGLTWRFAIRKGVTFHDGSPLTARSVRDSLSSALERTDAGALYPGLLDIIDISPVTDDDLTIKLRRRSAFLLDDLEFPISRTAPDRTVIGTGAFKIVRQEKAEVIMEPHRAYHQGTPQIDRLIFTAFPTLRMAWASLMRQEIDALLDVAHESTEFVDSANVQAYSYLRHYVSLVAFNSARTKLATPAVRRALNAAIDRGALIRDVLQGHGIPANGPLWPHHWAYDSTLPGYAHDPSLASTTLDAAGVRRPPQVPGRPPARFSFACMVIQNYALQERLALNVQKQLYDIGVDMQIEAVSAEEYVKRIHKSDFDAVLIEMISGPMFARAYQFWRSTSGFTGLNVFGYQNLAADRWFDALRYAPGEAEYRAAAGQLQRVLLDDPPALFLVWNERTRVVSRRFRVPVEAGRDPMPMLWRWTVDRDRTPTTH